MRLEPLYRLTFHYRESWFVELDDERGIWRDDPLPPAGARPSRPSQVIGFATHVSSDERYKWLNDGACGLSGEVREGKERTDIVLDVAELVWEPLPERPSYDSSNGN